MFFAFRFGPVGCKSPLHHDPYHNLLAQVCGYKFVRLFAPSESKYLKPRNGKFYNNSSIDLEEEFKGKEVVQSAKYSDILLEPGDMLYIPRWYWHFIASISEPEKTHQIGEKRKLPLAHDGDCNDDQGHHDGNGNSKKASPPHVFSVSFWWGERKEKIHHS